MRGAIVGAGRLATTCAHPALLGEHAVVVNEANAVSVPQMSVSSLVFGDLDVAPRPSHLVVVGHAQPPAGYGGVAPVNGTHDAVPPAVEMRLSPGLRSDNLTHVSTPSRRTRKGWRALARTVRPDVVVIA